MSSKKLILSAFILVALAQLFVPAKMIFDKEDTLKTGTDYKFNTAPIDPSDPFRGKYIILSYRDNIAKVKNEKDWVSGEIVYVFLEKDQNDFAKIIAVSKEKPTENQGFVKAKVSFVSSDGNNKVTIYYPFDRFYMEESKASEAEVIYTKTLQDTTKRTYALVRIKNGDAVLKDVLIDEISIREIVKKQQQQNNK